MAKFLKTIFNVCKLVLIFLGIFLLYNIATLSTDRANSTIRKNLTHRFAEGEDTPNKKWGPVVKLYDQGGNFFCSGWVVDNHYIVTAAHCLATQTDDLSKSEIHIYDSKDTNTLIKGKPAGIANRTDFGIIEGNFSDFQKLSTNFVSYGFNKPGIYYTCGFPYGGDLACQPFLPVSNNYFLVIGTGYLVPGQSGGPVLDPDGIAVGLNSQVSERGVCVAPIEGLLGAFGIN